MGAEVFPWSGGVWGTPATFSHPRHSTVGQWDNPASRCRWVQPSLINDPGADTLTFVGTVLKACLTNINPFVDSTIEFLAPVIPQAGLITTQLGLPADNGDQLYTMSGGVFNTPSTFAPPRHSTVGAWDIEPNIAVGQGFGYYKAATWYQQPVDHQLYSRINQITKTNTNKQT